MTKQTHDRETEPDTGQQADVELLSLFVDFRDEAAFEELVRRHCGLVLGVCRRALRNAHDVEDVFQATFLVLARDAKVIRKQASLTNWLYGVAYRLAMLVVRRQVRRRETRLEDLSLLSDHSSSARGDLADEGNSALIDEELNALPEKYRQPIVLHYLSGRTQQQVADELGLTVGAVDGLLKRGRKELRSRLARRGIELGAAMAVIQASQNVAQAAELNVLVLATVKAGLAFTSNQVAAGTVPLAVAELAGKELIIMSTTSKSLLAGAGLASVLVVGGAAWAVGTGNLGGGRVPNAVPAQVPQPAAVTNVNPEVPPTPLIDEKLEVPVPAQQAKPERNDQLAQKSDSKQPESKGGEKKYTSADEAFAMGAVLYNARNFAGSQEPFEAALKLAPDDKYRIRVYRALMGAYRQLPEIDKFVEAADFIITKSEQAAERSVTRSDLLSFVHQRGKVNELADKYEEVLKNKPKSETALYILTELYAELKQNPKRSAELLERLGKLNTKQGEALNVADSAKLAQQYVKQGKFKAGAELFEKIAPLDKALAAWHWKDAAQAWVKAKEKARALDAAKMSAAAGPEKRGELLLHFWHRALGQVFLEVGEPELAIPHFEEAIKSTTIEAYLKDTKGELATAKEQAEKRKSKE